MPHRLDPGPSPGHPGTARRRLVLGNERRRNLFPDQVCTSATRTARPLSGKTASLGRRAARPGTLDDGGKGIMSMVATPRPMTLPVESGHSPGLIPIPGESRIVIRHIGWHVYKCLSEAIGEGRHVRLAYDGKALEIMVTSYLHEHFKQLLNKVLAAVMLALGIDHLDGGETTWDTEESERGLQADLSYYFDREKICVAREALARQSQNP